MRRLVVMFLLVVGLGAFWYFHDLRGVEEERRQEELAQRVFPQFSSSDIQSITWSDGAQTPETVRVYQRLPLGWQVELPKGLKVRIKANILEDASKQIANLARLETILEDPTPQSLAQYGLDKPKHRMLISYRDSQGKAAQVGLIMGNILVDDSGIYARLTDNDKAPVLAVPDLFVTSLMTLLRDLRETKLLACTPEEIESFKYISYEGSKPGSFTLTAKEEAPPAPAKNMWGQEIEEPAPAIKEWYVEGDGLKGELLADERKVNDFLWSLQDLKIERFLHPEEPKLGKVRARYEVRVKGAPEPLVVEIGQAVAGQKGQLYASRNQPQESFQLAYGDLEEGLKTLVGRRAPDFEDRHLVRAKLMEIAKIDLEVASKRPQGPFRLEAQRQGEEWLVEAPKPSLSDAAQRRQKVEGLLYNLLDLEWAIREKGAKPANLDPVARFALYAEGGQKLASLEVYEESKDRFSAYLEDGSKVTLHKDPRAPWIEACEDLVPEPPQEEASATPTPQATPQSTQK